MVKPSGAWRFKSRAVPGDGLQRGILQRTSFKELWRVRWQKRFLVRVRAFFRRDAPEAGWQGYRWFVVPVWPRSLAPRPWLQYLWRAVQDWLEEPYLQAGLDRSGE